MRQVPEKPTRARLVTAALWCLSAMVVVWVCVAWMPLVFAGRAAEGQLGQWFWAFDVFASLASQSVVVVALVAMGCVVARRWCASGVVVAALIALVALPLSEPRLARARSDERAVRIVIHNARTGSGAVEAKNELMLSADADVIAMLEAPIEFVSRYMSGELLDGYASVWRPKGPWSGCPILVSRLPMHEHGSDLAQIRRRLWDHLYLLEIVRTPNGDVAVVLMHARSPRRPWRWSSGLEQLSEAAELVREIGETTGLPVVVVGDFNSTPTSVRGRAFAEMSGLVRGKPALKVGGTFPSWAPGAAGLAIDGVYASPGVRIAGWEPIGSAGSDHRALVVELVIDQPASVSE